MSSCCLPKIDKIVKLKPQDQLFMVIHKSELQLLTTFKVTKQLAVVITQMNLDPGDYGFHMFRRSGGM